LGAPAAKEIISGPLCAFMAVISRIAEGCRKSEHFVR